MSEQLDRIEVKLDTLIELLTAKKKRTKAPEGPIKAREDKFISMVMEYHSSNYPKSMLVKFYEYWTERGPRDRKMRFEKQTSFDIGRRLARWKRNNTSSNENNDFGESDTSGITVFT